MQKSFKYKHLFSMKAFDKVRIERNFLNSKRTSFLTSNSVMNPSKFGGKNARIPTIDIPEYTRNPSL